MWWSKRQPDSLSPYIAYVAALRFNILYLEVQGRLPEKRLLISTA